MSSRAVCSVPSVHLYDGASRHVVLEPDPDASSRVETQLPCFCRPCTDRNGLSAQARPIMVP